ncbi:MAG: hypothetical protein JRI96_16555 [Deltaproteobacteria bacterium]|nr:hypothetical protein [Deltaproteobacteria bacterium]
MYYVGCDQHKHYSVVTAKDKDGAVMAETKKIISQRTAKVRRILFFFAQR